MGAELCIPGHQVIGSAHVERLDQAIRHYNEPLGILKEFILPGGSPAAAQAHVLRCVARRAERSVVAVPSEALPQDGPRLYLNRLSDLLFVLARTLNRHAGRSDVLWEPKRNEADKD
jgi:cob(I)alamin adenosyltransferase